MSREIPTRARVNWCHIADAVEFYERHGFVYVETPWRVHDDVVTATKPPEAVPFRCRFDDATRPDVLVGSAEQGLLSIATQLRPNGLYVSVSPCFRDNEVDELHFSDFVKVELMVWEPKILMLSVYKLLNQAEALAQANDLDVECIETDGNGSFDLMAGGIEIGSYGWRRATIDGIERTWVYGTGLAEPRFSQALARQHRTKA